MFQCQASPEQPGQALIPNIPDFYFDSENAAAFSSDPEGNLTLATQYRTYIYTIPPDSHSRCGEHRAVGIQYCYRETNYGVHTASERRVLELLQLSRNGSDFVVERTAQVLSDSDSTFCSPLQYPWPDWFEQVCCGTSMLNSSDSFRISPSGQAFGITTRTFQPLSFTLSATQYNVEHLQVYLSTPFPTPSGLQFTVRDYHRKNEPVLFIRLVLGKNEDVASIEQMRKLYGIGILCFVIIYSYCRV